MRSAQPSQAEGFLLEKQRAVLFINGVIENISTIPALLKENDYLVAVDGGLRYLNQLDRRPNLLIGDLDSVSSEDIAWIEQQGIEIQRFPVEKDETDLELALSTVISKGCRELLLFGALGGRLDQTLGNLFLLASPDLADAQVRIINGMEEIFLIRRNAEIFGSAGDIVSLIPFSGNAVGVTTQGLKYPLTHETLFLQKSRGISNVMLADRAEVVLDSGILICIHTQKTNLEVE